MESKSEALVAAVFVDFPKNKCDFMHKNKLDTSLPYVSLIASETKRKKCSWVQFLTGRHPMRSFSAGAVAIALLKSAPMFNSNGRQWRSQKFSTGGRVRQSVAFLSVHSRSAALQSRPYNQKTS